MAADGSSGGGGGARPCFGLVVVHGVGETEPGYCVNAILDTLAERKPGYHVSSFNEYTRLPEPEIATPPPVFPVIRRAATHDAGFEVEAVELHWADLTEMQPGRVNTLLGLFRVIFESHHLVDAMLDKSRDTTSWLLRKILWIAGWLLRGPIAGLTIATTAICALFLFEPVSVGVDVMGASGQVLAAQAVLFVGAIYVFYQIVQTRDYSWYDSVFWLAAMTFVIFVLVSNDALLVLLDKVPALATGPPHAVAAAAAAGHAVNCTAIEAGAGCYVNGLYKVIIWGWRFWGALMLAATAFLALAMSRARKSSDHSRLATLSTSIGILITQFLLWTTVVVSVAYPMLNRAETISTLKAARPIIVRAIEAGEIKGDGQVAKLVQVPDIELDWIGRFKFIYASAALTVLLFLLAAWFLMALRKRKARSGSSDLERIARQMPRLIFNPHLVGLLISAFVVVFALVFIQPYLDNNGVFVSLRNFILPVAAAVALILPFFFGHHVANVVHIARDLIDHHYMPKLETATYFFPSIFRARHGRPRRERLQQRLKTVLQNFIEHQGYSEVIFIAHSQGSVIVYDYLRDNGPEYAELGGAPPAMLTFGSPLGTIYQKYFHEYAVNRPAPDGMATRLKCWINLFRVDDYIGGHIHAPPGLRIENRIMDIGGHTSYWTEAAVADALDDILLGKVTDATKPPPLPGSAPDYVRAMREV